MSPTALCPFVIIFGRTSFYYKLNTVEIGEIVWILELQWFHFLDILDPEEYNFSCNWWCVYIRAKQKTIQSKKEAKNYFILEQQFIPSIEMQSINLRNQINLFFCLRKYRIPPFTICKKICKKTFLYNSPNCCMFKVTVQGHLRASSLGKVSTGLMIIKHLS